MAVPRPTRALYLCYFGLREPLVQTQVLPYLRQLSAGGVEVSLLTFEPERPNVWPSPDELTWRRHLEADGIRWHWLPYHKRPSLPATLVDVVAGACVASRLARQAGIRVLHARAHVPMAMALLARWWTDCRLVFDIRGLVAEEYADAGVWAEGSLPFRGMKWLERVGIRRADQVVVLTERLRAWLIEHGRAPAGKIEVIPCCVDFDRYVEAAVADETAGSDRFEIVYAGSVTGLYMLEEMGQFFQVLKARQPDALLRVLTGASPEATAAVLRRAGLATDDFWIGAVPPAVVPAYLGRARLGLSFRKPTFSQIAASPTKIPEYLAAGLPVVCNGGIGDMDELVERERVGVVIRSFDSPSYRSAIEQAGRLAADPSLGARCRRVARERFDLVSVGGAAYRRVYARLQEPPRPSARVRTAV